MVKTAEVKSKVLIRRDERWIPYISAAADGDLYFAQGYTVASDRLWQMDLLRRVAGGETAEIFGRQAVEEDKRWRRFGFKQIAADSLQFLSPEIRATLDAYARGVNAYIAQLDEKSWPVEFRILQYKPRPWQSTDSILIGKILADALSTTWRNDLLHAAFSNLPSDKFADLNNQVTPYDVVLFGRDSPVARPYASKSHIRVREHLMAQADADLELRRSSLEKIGLYAEDLAASNNWVASGERTADGRAMLANDPHLRPTAPGIWYLAHLSTPTMRAAGVTFPGVPGIVLGHNETIAWGATNVGPDVQDLHIETFDSNGKYATPNGPRAPTIRREQIKVRTNPLKTDTEFIEFETIETRNGVVVAEEGGRKYALRWTARDPKNSELETFYRVNRASDWNQFKRALQGYGGATQNFVYADTAGNIGWYAAGKIPIRRMGDGSVPYDGAKSDGDWIGYIPFVDLPNLYNPPSGLIVTANQRIVGTNYKHTQMSRAASTPWRARRIVDMIDAKRKLTMADFLEVQRDAYNIPVHNFAKFIVAEKAAAAETVSLLSSWDGRMMSESKAAFVANEIRVCAANKIAEENKPVPASFIREWIFERAFRENLIRWLPKNFSDFKSLIRACDADATKTLTARYGADSDKWSWGLASRSRFPHPLDGAPLVGAQFATPSVGLAGSGQTPNVASFVSMQLIATPGRWDTTRHVIPLGQSGDPRSPHYKDQFEAWRTGGRAYFPFSRGAVEKATKVSLEIHPTRK
ncbi:MAG: penicillin acylase family protein [Acidobacteria bacterium]|nr:penicillin acylase family protein [Acidobacteriota bacterium]